MNIIFLMNLKEAEIKEEIRISGCRNQVAQSM